MTISKLLTRNFVLADVLLKIKHLFEIIKCMKDLLYLQFLQVLNYLDFCDLFCFTLGFLPL